jgi:hypothetical protein
VCQLQAISLQHERQKHSWGHEVSHRIGDEEHHILSTQWLRWRHHCPNAPCQLILHPPDKQPHILNGFLKGEPGRWKRENRCQLRSNSHGLPGYRPSLSLLQPSSTPPPPPHIHYLYCWRGKGVKGRRLLRSMAQSTHVERSLKGKSAGKGWEVFGNPLLKPPHEPRSVAH